MAATRTLPSITQYNASANLTPLLIYRSLSRCESPTSRHRSVPYRRRRHPAAAHPGTETGETGGGRDTASALPVPLTQYSKQRASATGGREKEREGSAPPRLSSPRAPSAAPPACGPPPVLGRGEAWRGVAWRGVAGSLWGSLSSLSLNEVVSCVAVDRCGMRVRGRGC